MVEFHLQPDSSSLWGELKGKVNPSFTNVLEQLDQYQQNEAISPYLAETFRRMIFDSVTDDPKWLNDLIFELQSRAISLDSRYIATRIEAVDGFRLRKAAEYVAERAGGAISPGGILAEYFRWHNMDDEELR